MRAFPKPLFPALLLAGAGACASVASAEAADPAAVFEALEERLLGAQLVRVGFTITSGGAVNSSLSGTLEVEAPNEVRLAAAGTFEGADVELRLASNGRQMEGGSSGGLFSLETPTYLGEGVLLGLTRMGLLHNLAMLSGGAPPQGTDGKAREWVQVSGFAAGATADQGGPARPISFAIAVDGKPAARATLWLDEVGGLPRMREQVVLFGEEEMQVLEEYDFFEVRSAP